MSRLVAIWVCFAAVMGFAVGGSFISAIAPISEVEKQRCYQGADAGHYKADECKTFWERSTTDPVAFYTLGLFVFTGVLAVSTAFLWDATQQAAVRQSDETKILQRAYLSVEPEGISASNSADKCHPNITIRNAGNLPARNVKWVIDYTVTLDDRLANFLVDEARAEGENTLTPGGGMKQGGKIIYIGNDPGDLRKQIGLYLYVWGAVYYDDGFGIDRTTRFCHRYNSVNLEDVTNNFHRPDGSILLRSVVGKKIDAQFARIHRYGNDAD